MDQINVIAFFTCHDCGAGYWHNVSYAEESSAWDTGVWASCPYCERENYTTLPQPVAAEEMVTFLPSNNRCWASLR